MRYSEFKKQADYAEEQAKSILANMGGEQWIAQKKRSLIKRLLGLK